MNQLTGPEIYNRLQISDRWGTNNQPSIFLATAILEQLPVGQIAVGGEGLQIAFIRDLTPLEYWAIERLTPDKISRDDRLFDLWWD